MGEVEGGWIKLYRKLQQNNLWTSEPFTRGQAWVDLLLLANHKEGYIRVRGIKIPISRGQVGWSEQKLAIRWQWSRTKVRSFVLELQKEQQIEQQKNFKTSIISIINYEEYQGKEQQEEQEKEQQKDSRKTAERQQKDTNKNDKNNKNEKNIRNIIPPQIEWIIDYCKERENGIDPHYFHDWYTARGWKYKGKLISDWQATVRTWERNTFKKPQQQVNVSEITDEPEVSDEQIKFFKQFGDK